MLHAHVEALLHHCVFGVHIRARADLIVGAMLMNVRCQTLHLEPLFLRIENSHVVLAHLVSRLLESARSCQSGSSGLVLWLCNVSCVVLLTMLVLSWPWHIKLKTLSVEDLIVVKAWRSLVKTNIFARENFIVSCTTL